MAQPCCLPALDSHRKQPGVIIIYIFLADLLLLCPLCDGGRLGGGQMVNQCVSSFQIDNHKLRWCDA